MLDHPYLRRECDQGYVIYFVILDYGNVRKNQMNQTPWCHIKKMYITSRVYHYKPNTPINVFNVPPACGQQWLWLENKKLRKR